MCNPAKNRERSDHLKREAQVKSFKRQLASQAEQAKKIRIMLARKATSQGDTFCMTFNQTGIPCSTECPRYPCKDWDDLMQPLLATSVYKLMPTNLRQSNKSHRGVHSGVRKARAKANKTHFKDDEMCSSSEDADL